MPPAGGQELERLGRLYSALSQINQAIVRKRSQRDLFPTVCEILVEPGGFGMAWIGWHDPETQRLMPVASAGDQRGYLDTIEIYADDRLEGRGPTGLAFRANRPYVCNDLFLDPVTVPWRGELERRGFRSAVALPIQLLGKAAGTLSVFAERAGFFRDHEVGLLTEVAADISFALDNLDREAARERAETTLESEQRLASGLIEAMPGIFYLYDEAGRFLRWNRNFERVSGYSGEEIRAMHPLDFFAPEAKPLMAERIARVFAQGEGTAEASFLAKDTSTVPHFFTGKRIVLEGKACLVGVGVDVQERQRAEDAVKKSEERYRTTLDSMLEGCQLIGFDWRYLYLNPRAAVHNRRPNSELLGARMQDAWPGIEATEVFQLLCRCMEQRTPVHNESEFAFADGSKAWFDVRAQPVPEGIFVLSIDISKRKHAEQALRELNERLEHKVAERTVALEAARERAELADRIKSAFLATMSHELRTPLNSILGFTGIVLNGMAGPLNPEQTKQLGMVQGSARHLLDLINDVLDISKIEAGQLEVRCAPFDLRASLERVLSSVGPLAEKKGLCVRAQLAAPPGPMESDRRRVEQIVINLLNNAIKFTDRGEVLLTLEVTTGGEPDSGDEARPFVAVRVADTGMGIKEEDLTQLFQPFRQLDSGLQRQHEGTGLGLAICRRLTELLGGTIHAESAFGHGSVFTVRLPLAPKPSS
jgi:PAS domain S-box-containing protein